MRKTERGKKKGGKESDDDERGRRQGGLYKGSLKTSGCLTKGFPRIKRRGTFFFSLFVPLSSSLPLLLPHLTHIKPVRGGSKGETKPSRTCGVRGNWSLWRARGGRTKREGRKGGAEGERQRNTARLQSKAKQSKPLLEGPATFCSSPVRLGSGFTD